MEKSEAKDNMTDSDRIGFLESMLSHYESLVQDMSGELVQCKDDLHKFTVTDVEGRESKFPCTKCEMQEMCVENLRKQIEVVNKAKEIQHCLWKSSMEQLENYETRKVNFHHLVKEAETKELGQSQNRMPMPTVEDLFTKWKLLQIYTTGLESRVEKTILENKMYRRRLLETKLENEVHLKKQAAERMREVENVKNSFAKEIEYLKASVEKSRKALQEAIELRVEKEHETWRNQEDMIVRELEKKIESINADREALLMRDNQMAIQLREIAKELVVTRKHLELAEQEKWRMAMTMKIMLPQHESKPKVLKNPPILLVSEVQTEELQEVKQLKDSRTQMQHIQDEFSTLVASKTQSEKDNEERISRVLTRLSTLEQINSKLENEIAEQEKEKFKLQSELDDAKKKLSLKRIVPNVEEFMHGHGDVRKNTNLNPTELAAIFHVQKIEEKRREIREMTLTEHIKSLEAERHKLITMLEKQKSVAHRWEIEYKTLLQSIET